MNEETMNDTELPEEEMQEAAEPEIAEAETAEADELSALRAALAEKERLLSDMTAAKDRFESEFAEFRREFPEVPLGRVDDGVWEMVRGGVPLAAAYALAERRAMKQAQASRRETGAWHSLSGGTDEGLFSPSEVRAMTPREVRRNYDRILESMKRW